MAGKQTPLAPSSPRAPARSALIRLPVVFRHLCTDTDTRATEETRRSGRANKGQHTKNQDSLEEPAPVPKTKAQLKAEKKAPPKGKGEAVRAQSTQSADQEEEEEEDAVIRCVCGDQRDIRGREMICCDSCEAWQHNKCLSLPEGGYWENRTYYCERCRPGDHQELLAAMARGEKPWARKKGSKPKPRPSDVKQEESGGTPSQPPAEDTPSQTPARNTAETPTPAPAPAEPQTAPSNGHPEPKVDNFNFCQATINLTVLQAEPVQPQSPTGEKRRHDTTTEKANKKRRKSSQHQEKAAPPAPTVNDIDALAPTQKPFAEKLRDTFAPLITAASSSRGFRIPDGETAKSMASKIALQVSQATVAQYGDPAGGDSPYSQRVRAIMFNAKKNALMIDRILSGSMKAKELATMPIEEMASEDQQKENAAIREAALKQSILLDEAGPRLRKTHKGEEIVGEDNMETHEFKQPVLRERESISEDVPMQSPVTSRPPESPADGQHRPSMDHSGQTPDGARRPSTNFDINSVFDKVRSPQHDQQTFLLRRQSSLQSMDKAPLPVDDADVDRLLKDEDNDTDMVGYSSDPSVCWHGSISMQGLQPFDAVARHVAGGDFGQVVPWDKLITNTVSVQGRIESSKGDEYIQSIATSDIYDVAVLSLSPVTSEARAVMDHFYTYFHSRGRWGVVPVENMAGDVMRDLYVIPVEAGGSNLPPFIDMLEHCTIETPRKEHMVLLALVAKLPEVKLQQPELVPQPQAAIAQPPQSTPPANGPSPSPVNPHAPQYSPMAQNFPPAQYNQSYTQQPMNGGHQYPQPPPQYQVPPHHQIPKAVDILGPFIDAPVVMQILVENLSKNEAVSEVIMANIRHIMDTKPAARTDMKSFTDALFEQKANANGGQSHAQ